uniref:Amino acid permease n=1 Tax=Roseihalotalea indica TaxID=2867963 RepID=A0AA49GKS9_9BACT|nr:amino acid permease [Tunicatimonas sp. TK19036]
MQYQNIKKPLSMYDQDMRRSGLKKVLGKWSLTSLGVGAVIGAGIFVMTGLAAREFAGPALVLSFVVAGTGCAFAALCYAEFASLLPVEGSAYAYSFATVGELFAWIIGWDLILEYAMSAATVAVGWSGYLGKILHLLHIRPPLWLMQDAHTARHLLEQSPVSELTLHYSSLNLPSLGSIPVAINLPAFCVVLVITFILIRGVQEAARTNLIMVIMKVVVVLFVIVVGAFYVNPENWHPFIPERTTNDSGDLAFGISGILAGAAYVFFAYIGFDAVSTQAGEAHTPRKDVPFGILVSLLICTVLYILVSLVLTGMVKYTQLDLTAPIAAAFAAHNLSFAVWIISLAALAGLTSVLLVTMLAQTRLFYAMAQDGLLPLKTFGDLHEKFRTPVRGTILTGLVVAMVASVTPIELIAKLVNIGTLFAFTMVCIAVWRMRYKEPTAHRPFKVPYLPVIASLGILFNVGLMFSLEWENWARLGLWLVFGLVVYIGYGYRNSKVRKAREPLAA